MGRRRMIGTGSTCSRLIKFLEKDGHKVSAVYPATGAWRHVRMDVMSWEMHITRKGNRYEESIGCWENITQFLKNASKFGYDFTDKDQALSGGVEIWAREK